MEHPWSGNPDELVPTVDPADVKAIWQLHRDVEARHPGQQVGIGRGLFESVCHAGADISSVAYRAGMLEVLYHMVREVPEASESQTLAKHRRGDELDEALFRVMAEVPLRWIPEGGMQGFPFDGEEFIKRVEEEV